MIDRSPYKMSQEVIDEVMSALQSIKSYGSIEIYVQDNVVTQITVRNIKKFRGEHNGVEKHETRSIKVS
ncbi:MAG: hypothetical protein UX31_C0003G0025 [Candidatus Nomurabacteria bacterium GW2011_GWA1_46_11]|uniref:DUF2292 domain-containing protein n=1 Tax=Candidatus Nomurabacteria bacterium GW2011_GWA1_46_11 TaxID=1618732 RepID=A0A0G1NNX5_9BACT|nr:MAG: hypothetical protein UW69_C0026G0002 [Microgenomates group bacterium GW2011_GWA2_44_7]KKT78301.1 MAG: hypothetical protein UW73_C0004G0025 [Microgenomates group bacterium GW2011_GWB1_44_8]KKU22359.1 MAG: hypothetical protein UX31_C0003G0025 [Candidatus Nomurabacteria bacterium GW2011_GWA1_46_11]